MIEGRYQSNNDNHNVLVDMTESDTMMYLDVINVIESENSPMAVDMRLELFVDQ